MIGSVQTMRLLAHAAIATAVGYSSLAADIPDPAALRMMEQVKQTDLVNLVRQISGEDALLVGGNPFLLTNRWTPDTVCITRATQFAHDELQALGLGVSYQSWSGGSPPTRGRNVIAVQPGGSLSNEIVYVTAHIDDMPGTALSPGADDNASGTAAVLTAARIFSQHRFNRTIKYAIFTGEEEMIAGSAETAKQAYRAGERIVAVVNIDMIAWASATPPRALIRIPPDTMPGYTNNLSLASVFTNLAGAYGLTKVIEPAILADGRTGDQANFWQYGYAGFMATEDEYLDFNPNYHTSGDKLSQLNLAYYTAFAQASIGTAAQVAQPAAEAPFEAIEVASSDWRTGSPIGVGNFYARHDAGAAESGPDVHDVSWSGAVAPTNRLWFKAASLPDGTELQTDSRPWTSESLFSGNLVFVNKTATPASVSNAIRFRFISPPLSNRVYAVLVRINAGYTANGAAFESITNLQQLIALGDGLLKLPTLTNLTDGTVYGTFDIAARFLDRTSAFALRVDSVPEQGLVVSVPAQVGAVVTDSFEVSTDLGSEAVWEPLISSTNYVGAANSQEFDAGWSRVATQVDTRSWTRAGTHFLRLKRTWQN